MNILEIFLAIVAILGWSATLFFWWSWANAIHLAKQVMDGWNAEVEMRERFPQDFQDNKTRCNYERN